VLVSEAIEVLSGMVVIIVESSDEYFHLVLSPKPAAEFSEGDVKSVAGNGPQGHRRKSNRKKWIESQG